MADQQQHKDMNDVVQQEPLTGLSLISDARANANTSKKSTALAEVNPNSVSNINGSAAVITDPKTAMNSKNVSIVEPNEEVGCVNENLEVALPEGDDHEDRLEEDVDGANTQMAVGEKRKRSKKKKPKSQRGLVRFQSVVKDSSC